MSRQMKSWGLLRLLGIILLFGGLDTVAAAKCTAPAKNVALVEANIANSIYFCNYFLNNVRTHSPITELDATTLNSACQCILIAAGQNVPVPKPKPTLAPGPKLSCVAADLKILASEIKEVAPFCKWFYAIQRDVSPVRTMSVQQVKQGCGCVKSSTTSKSTARSTTRSATTIKSSTKRKGSSSVSTARTSSHASSKKTSFSKNQSRTTTKGFVTSSTAARTSSTSVTTTPTSPSSVSTSSPSSSSPIGSSSTTVSTTVTSSSVASSSATSSSSSVTTTSSTTSSSSSTTTPASSTTTTIVTTTTPSCGMPKFYNAWSASWAPPSASGGVTSNAYFTNQWSTLGHGYQFQTSSGFVPSPGAVLGELSTFTEQGSGGFSSAVQSCANLALSVNDNAPSSLQSSYSFGVAAQASSPGANSDGSSDVWVCSVFLIDPNVDYIAADADIGCYFLFEILEPPTSGDAVAPAQTTGTVLVSEFYNTQTADEASAYYSWTLSQTTCGMDFGVNVYYYSTYTITTAADLTNVVSSCASFAGTGSLSFYINYPQYHSYYPNGVGYDFGIMELLLNYNPDGSPQNWLCYAWDRPEGIEYDPDDTIGCGFVYTGEATVIT